MKVYFKKSYRYYEIDHVSIPLCVDRKGVDSDEWNLIIKKIRNSYESVKTHNMITRSGRGHIFSFGDVADEAAFLLCSYDGLEI